MQMTLRDWVLLLVLSVLWGGTFFFTAIAVKEIPPLTLVFLRISIASIILFCYLYARGVVLPKQKPALLAFMTMGVLNIVIPFSLFFWAQTAISGSLASILNAATPVFSILIANALLADEKMTSAKVIGVLFGVSGVAVLLGGDIVSGFSATTLGITACLVAVIFQGFAVTYGRRFKAMGIPNTAVAFGQLSAATLVLLPVVAVVDHPWSLPIPSTAAVASTLALATVSTALAYVIFFRLLSSAGAVNVSLVTLLIPLSATLLGMGFLGERLEGPHYFGMALIAIGLGVLDGRPVALARRVIRMA